MAFTPEIRRLVFFIFQVYCALVNLFFRYYNQLFVKREKIAPPKDEILLSSATKLAEKIRKKELTSSQVLEAFIGRVEEVNPVLNAVVVKLYDDARATAKKVDERLAKLSAADRQKLADTEPLLGVPISIKDNFDVEGKVCTAGSPFRKDNVASKDAVVVANLRAAGAIPFVMTNVPECVVWLECSNVVYGRTGNAHDPRRNPGGSSGGEGSLVGSAGSVFGIGNDLGGSVRCPSFLNGIFGLKPSPNKNSKVGVFPFVRPELYISDMFVNGPLCRYAEDLELLFKAMGGQVAKDLWKKAPLPAKKQRFFFLDGFHLTFVEELNEDQRGALYRVVNHIRSEWNLPVTQVEFEELDSAPEIYAASWYDAPDDEPTCWDIISQGKYTPNKWLDFPKALLGQSPHSPQPYYLTHQLDLIQWWNNIPQDRQKYIALREQLKKKLFGLLGDDGVLLFPTMNCSADFYNGMGFKQNGWYYTAFWNAMLVPSVTCPIGKNADGMPLGVQVIGPPDSDARILEIAKEFEKAFGGWSLAE